jgi:hypothetical protein
MSWATCYGDGGCNNIDFSAPPMMMDGRFFTSYNPPSITASHLKRAEGIRSNWDYRQYIQQNAVQIMKYNNEECYSNLGIGGAATAPMTQRGNTTPKLFTSTHDTSEPPFGYCKSQLKSSYLSRHQLNAKLIAPVIDLSSA